MAPGGLAQAAQRSRQGSDTGVWLRAAGLAREGLEAVSRPCLRRAGEWGLQGGSRIYGTAVWDHCTEWLRAGPREMSLVLHPDVRRT